ncbi:MAG TPA: DUF3137 domain-containing protein [Chitinophagaceae bacterium]|nr:DUF3137 domain-containing protein [Chitinophagaceae bacterium]
MSPASDFTAFYEKELRELLLPLEDQRKKIKKWGVYGFVLLGLAIVFFIIGTTSQLPAAIIIAIVVFVAAIIVLILFANRLKKFTGIFKTQIVSRIVAFINPSLSYSPERFIAEADYKKSGLYLKSSDRYKGDDYVEGLHDKTFFCFSELHTEERVSSGKNTRWETIFKGMFIIADFNKNFSGRTYVWSENKPQLNFLNKLFSSFASGLEKVKLESPDFEKRFIVYSNDQVEARYILTPSFMERLVRLQQMTSTDTSMSFVQTNIHIAIPMNKELFEPSVFKANDFSRLEQFRSTIQIVYEIIDELKLNERLWTKE